MKKHKCLVIVLTGLMLAWAWGTPPVQASTIYVDDGQFTFGVNHEFPMYWYYNGNFLFSPTYLLSYAKLSIEGVSGYDYKIGNGHATLTSALVDDDSSGGNARGYFQGGCTLTIQGDLWNSTLYPNKNDDPYKYSGTILHATMTISASETWLFYEDALNDLYTGTVDFDPSTAAGTGLGCGIPIAGGNVLKMDDFRLNCIFMDCENIYDFENSAYVTSGAANFQTIAIPEPVSIVLLGAGALCCVRQSRKRL